MSATVYSQFAKRNHAQRKIEASQRCLNGDSADMVSYSGSVQFSDEKIWYIPRNALYVCDQLMVRSSSSERSPRKSWTA